MWNTHEISVILPMKTWGFRRSKPRPMKRSAARRPDGVSHLCWGKVGEGHLKKLPRILGISFGKQKLRLFFFGTGRETHFWRFLLECQNWVGCQFQLSSFLWTFLQAQWEERVAKHVAYKEKFEVEAEEAHLRTTTWFTKNGSQGGVPPPPPKIFPPWTFQFSFGPHLGCVLCDMLKGLAEDGGEGSRGENHQDEVLAWDDPVTFEMRCKVCSKTWATGTLIDHMMYAKLWYMVSYLSIFKEISNM